MNEKLEQMMEKVKANKPTLIRVGGIVLGALIGVTVAALVVNAQEAAQLESEEDVLDLGSEEETD